MRLELAPPAEAEMIAAARHYEDRAPGLGERFLDEVLRASEGIKTYPESWPMISGQIRRCLVKRFPFSLLFRIETERIYVLAVMHLHREPNYWRTRS